MKASAGIIFASLLIGSFVGTTIGAQTANVMHAARYMNSDWANLGPAFIILFGALSALGGLELGRWIVAVHSGDQHAPVGLKRRLGLARALMRLITAVIGLRLGYEAGMWTALIWDTWGSTAQNAADGSLELQMSGSVPPACGAAHWPFWVTGVAALCRPSSDSWARSWRCMRGFISSCRSHTSIGDPIPAATSMPSYSPQRIS
jgi:hypothetical protein